MNFLNKIRIVKKKQKIIFSIIFLFLFTISFSLTPVEAGGGGPGPTTLKITKLTSFGEDTFDFIVTGPTVFVPSIPTVDGVGISGPTVITPGTYSIQEIIPSGWDLTTASCNDGSSTFSIDTVSGIVINLESNIECTFENFPSGLSTPGQVTGLMVTPSGFTTMELVWNTPSDGGSPITGYMIERESPIGGGFAIVANTGTTSTNFVDSGLTHSTQYNYRVSAINMVGTGLASNENNATTLSPDIVLSDQASCEASPFFGTWTSVSELCTITGLTINPQEILQIDFTASLSVTGTFTNLGTVNSESTIFLSGNGINEATMVSMNLKVSGTFDNKGIYTGTDTLDVTGLFTNSGKVISFGSFGITTFNGGLGINTGTIDFTDGGLITVAANSVFENHGIITTSSLAEISTSTPNGVFDNYGILNNNGGSTIINRNTLNNFNLINNFDGNIVNRVGATINNQNVICGGTLDNLGTFTGNPFEIACTLGTLKITKLATGGDDMFTLSTTGPTNFQSIITTSSGTGMNEQNVVVGTYSVKEVGIPIDWTLNAASCNDGFSTFSIDTVSGIIINQGDNIECIFANEFGVSSPDTDGDGIFNEVDTFPTVPSDDFSDVSIGGTTFGNIITRGDQILTVTEEANPTGVRIMADPSGGLTPALIDTCGGLSKIGLTPGDNIVVTCGSITIDVINGPIEITFISSEGTQATTSISSGNSITFDQDKFSFVAPPTNAQTIIIDVEGTPITINPGDTNTSPPEVGTIIAPEDPKQIGTLVSASGFFTDLGPLETHTAVFDWGDQTTSVGVVSENGLSGTVTGSHTYSTPGVYTVTLTVTDDSGDSGSSIFQFVVIYDPTGGFVTGGGWIDSPTGAYVPDSSLVGKATFGFVSKYQQGTNTPTGNTQFSFQVADLKFKSTAYDWLVVAGSNAKFKGTGTINGLGNYGFQLFGFDADVNTNDNKFDDKFRIKIWDKNNGDVVVYDNNIGQSEDSEPSTILGGGSIVIHKP